VEKAAEEKANYFRKGIPTTHLGKQSPKWPERSLAGLFSWWSELIEVRSEK
jgi:hypothetical protein